MKSILVLADSDLSRDPRVRRQVAALAAGYRVTVLGRGKIDLAGVRQFRFEHDPSVVPRNSLVRIVLGTIYGSYAIRALNKIGRVIRKLVPGFPRIKRKALFAPSFEAASRRAARKLAPDLVIANDHTALRAGVEAKRAAGQGTKLLYDAHEFTPGQFAEGDEGMRKVAAVRAELTAFLPICDAMSTVCDGIAERYAREFCVVKPTVIVNACDYQPGLAPNPSADGRVRLVHHGLAVRRRSLETMIEAAQILGEGYSLDLYLISSSQEYLDELAAIIDHTANVRLHDPVPVDVLPETLNRYDIGVYSLKPVNINQALALPNKLFEFIQARLAIAIGPSPEMRKLVEGHGLGVVARDFSAQALAEAIRGISRSEIDAYKARADAVARELSFEGQATTLDGVVEGLIGERAT